jgi:hypothetical protein
MTNPEKPFDSDVGHWDLVIGTFFVIGISAVVISRLQGARRTVRTSLATQSREGAKERKVRKNGWKKMAGIGFEISKPFPMRSERFQSARRWREKIVRPRLPTFPLFLDSLCGSLRLGDFASTKTKCVVRPAPT